MNPRKYALVGGIVMLLMGICAFVPTLTEYRHESLLPLKFNQSYGLFLGLFPMNLLNKVGLIFFGFLGIGASRSENAMVMSIQWSRAVFYIMGALALMGIFPRTQTFFGYWPLYGGEVWVHGIFASLGAAFGYPLQTRVKAPDNVRHFPKKKAA